MEQFQAASVERVNCRSSFEGKNVTCSTTYRSHSIVYNMATACVGMFIEVRRRSRATILELGMPGIAMVEIAVRKLEGKKIYISI